MTIQPPSMRRAAQQAVPKKLSQLQNDTGFVTASQVDQSETGRLAHSAVQPDAMPAIPTKVSQLQNDRGYMTAADMPEKPTPQSIGAATEAQGRLAETAVQPSQLPPTPTPASIGAATAAQGRLAETAVQPAQLPPAPTLQSLGAASAAQGARADSAVQPGQLPSRVSQLTNDAGYITASAIPAAPTLASLGAASAAQGAKADSAVQPAALAAYARLDQIPRGAEVVSGSLGSNSQVVITFPQPYSTAPKVIPILTEVGGMVIMPVVVSVTTTSATVRGYRTTPPAVISIGLSMSGAQLAPQGTSVSIAVLP